MNEVSKKIKYTVGIDEVGRGPIAGPVAVGAFVFLDNKVKKYFSGVKESKQLSEEKREEWFSKILELQKNGAVDFAVTFESEKVIDKKGLSFAIKSALRKSLYMVVRSKKIKDDNPSNFKVLLDGGLRAPAEFGDQKTIIKGDEKEMTIALASICAKVLRDRKMKRFTKKFPEYSFDIHKGYGTKGHYEAIKKHGVSEIHRRSFFEE